MSKRRVLNLRNVSVVWTGCAPQMSRSRLVIPLTGHRQDDDLYHNDTDEVRLHITWDNLPWLMRLIWSAWWHHKKTQIEHLDWIEKELGGAGVKRP